MTTLTRLQPHEKGSFVNFLSISFTSCTILVCLASSVGRAQGCFRQHLTEGLAHNQDRQKLYSNLTHGATKEISAELIYLEKMAIFGSYGIFNLDKQAVTFESSGIPIVCDAFVPMSNTPQFRVPSFETVSTEALPDPTQKIDLDPYLISRQLRLRLRQDETLELFYKETVRILQRLHGEPRFNCLTRHLLESVTRAAAQAPVFEEIAKQNGFNDKQSLKISAKIIQAQMYILNEFIKLDDKATPLQVKGIPILCQDVPPIPIIKYGDWIPSNQLDRLGVKSIVVTEQ
jgi:hypothetical protein